MEKITSVETQMEDPKNGVISKEAREKLKRATVLWSHAVREHCHKPTIDNKIYIHSNDFLQHLNLLLQQV